MGLVRHAMHMGAALAGCRVLLVDTDWTNSNLVSTKGCRNDSPLTISGSFQSGGALFPDCGLQLFSMRFLLAHKQNR